MSDLGGNLFKFINLVTKLNEDNILAINTLALSLLESTPAAKDAVFEYFNMLFQRAVDNYVSHFNEAQEIDEDAKEPDEIIAITEAHAAINKNIVNKPKVWAPIVSSWALNLLGKVSTRYSNRGPLTSNATLNDKMQVWMGCRATRTLIDLTTQCLACLTDAEVENCVAALLDASIKYAPDYDWVVAHVGNSFPDNIITRILSCGLKDFVQLSRISANDEKRARIASIVGVVDHFGASHFDDVRVAVLNLFQRSFSSSGSDNDVKHARKATVPYLLQLAVTSPIICRALTINIQQTVNIKIVQNLSELACEWHKYFESSDKLVDLVIKLAINCDEGGLQIIVLLLECIASDELTRATRDYCKQLLDNIIIELEYAVRSNAQPELLTSIDQDTNVLEQLFLDTNPLQLSVASRLVALIGSKNPTVLMLTASFIMRHASNDVQLLQLIDILTKSQIYLSTEQSDADFSYLSEAIEHAITLTVSVQDDEFTFDWSVDADEDDKSHVHPYDVFTRKNDLFWRNLLKLLRWEKYQLKSSEPAPNYIELLLNERKMTERVEGKWPFVWSKMVLHALKNNLMKMAIVLGDCARYPRVVAHTIVEILLAMDVPDRHAIPLNLTMHITSAAVKYFFFCCLDDDPLLRSIYSNQVCLLLKRLCNSSEAARVFAIHGLLDESLFSTHSVLFGARYRSSKTPMDALLLVKNLKQGSSTFVQRNSTIFHDGIIMKSNAREVTNNLLDTKIIETNKRWLVCALESTCAIRKPPAFEISADAMQKIALYLVENISSDKMFNGLPWLDEEHTKVTFERDVHIRRMFLDLPILWTLLHMLTKHPPSVCFCSVLLRGLMASLLNQLNSLRLREISQQTRAVKRIAAAQNTELVDDLVRLFSVMALGQLLPKPLAFIQDVIPFFTISQIVHLIRECVWSYMRVNEHVPSPALFKVTENGEYYRDAAALQLAPCFTDALRLMMQKNIADLGEQFGLMFLCDVDKCSEGSLSASQCTE